MALAMVGEDAPVATNRVDLDPASKDVDGLPVARVTFKRHAYEQTASDFYGPKLVDVLISAGAKYAAQAPMDEIPRTQHQHGTLRMGANAATSVCNPAGRFHDIGNLYVASGSLFPTSSGFNPTLTIVALAARVAVRDGVPGRAGARAELMCGAVG
jgi:choline dehydrogenase-like flavoprotein